MRSLSPALLQAARLGAATPQVLLELIDLAPHYAPVFTSGPTGDNAAALAPDGAVVQVYHDGVATIYARRVADPTVPDWGPWTPMVTGAAPDADAALARLDDRLRLLWQDAATTGVYALDSFDGGRSWVTAVPAGAALFDPGVRLGALAADGAGETVFVAYAPGGAGSWRVAAWSLAGTWLGADWTSADAYLIAGLGAVRAADGSYLLAVAAQGAAGTGVALQTCTYISTGWGPPAETVVPADVGAGVAIAAPRLALYDGGYHLAYAVVDSGAVSGLPTARTALMHSLDGVHWTDPLEDAGTYAHGATPLKHAAGYLLVAPDAAALAPFSAGDTLPGGARYHDASPDIARLEVVQKDGDAARLVVTLQNQDATAARGGRAGLYSALPLLRPNALLRLALGYSGAGVVPVALFYVDDWSLAQAAGEDEVVITAADCSARLDRQSRTTLLYQARTVEWLAREIAARAGLPAVAVPTTAQFSYTVPLFSIPAGTTWRAALARLGRLYGFDAAARAQLDGTDALALCEKTPSDAAAWAYGDEVELQALARSGDRANHVLVFGAPAAGGAPPVGEAWDWADVAATGQERYLHVVESLITTRDGAALRAALELQREARAGQSASLSVPLHPGLELWDVIATSGASSESSGDSGDSGDSDGDTPTTLRIATLHYIYAPHPGNYDLVLTCEGV